jgi:LysM repeat protein
MTTINTRTTATPTTTLAPTWSEQIQSLEGKIEAIDGRLPGLSGRNRAASLRRRAGLKQELATLRDNPPRAQLERLEQQIDDAKASAAGQRGRNRAGTQRRVRALERRADALRTEIAGEDTTPKKTTVDQTDTTTTGYSVKTGDTIGAIAQRHGVSAQQLLDANPQITNADLIRVGERLKLPARTGASVWADYQGCAPRTLPADAEQKAPVTAEDRWDRLLLAADGVDLGTARAQWNDNLALLTRMTMAAFRV